MRTFVIGDVHGHTTRLVDLLIKADVVDKQGIKDDVEVILLGDVGHYDSNSHERDFLTWQIVDAFGITTIFGNHDYVAINPLTPAGFVGYDPIQPRLARLISRNGPMFALARHGYLLTHAGLAPRFAPPPGTTLEFLASVINASEGQPVIDDVSYRHAGNAPQGGILWRDASEPLADIPQIFGHTSGMIQRYGSRNQSWCIDVGSEKNGSLAGIWLPEMKVVAIGPDADIHEAPWEDSE